MVICCRVRMHVRETRHTKSPVFMGLLYHRDKQGSEEEEKEKREEELTNHCQMLTELLDKN